MNHIYVDGSYFIFYRVYAICVWWKNAHKDQPLSDPSTNEEFVEKYKKVFVDKIKEIPKKLGLKKQPCRIFVGRDCTQETIWRNSLFSEYKHGRNEAKNKETNIGFFFKLTYDEQLFEQAGVEVIYSHDQLEADDCIYLASKKHMSMSQDQSISCFVIASDHDYLQLASNMFRIFDLKYKDISTSKTSYANADKDLFMKVVLGDKSDNISPVFKNKRFGKAKAEKCYDDKYLFNKYLSEDISANEQYEKNSLLIDMKNIPTDLINSFYNKYGMNI